MTRGMENKEFRAGKGRINREKDKDETREKGPKGIEIRINHYDLSMERPKEVISGTFF